MADTKSLDKNSPTQTQDKSNDTKVPLMGFKTSGKEQEKFLKFHFDIILNTIHKFSFGRYRGDNWI